MITSISIKNFKALEHLTLDKCAGITLISGKNNVGKSTLLEGVFLFIDRNRPDTLVRPYGFRGIGSVSLSQEQFFDPIFTEFDRSRTISIELQIGRRSESIVLRHETPKVARIAADKSPRRGTAPAIPTDASGVPSHLAMTYRRGGRIERGRYVIKQDGLVFEAEDSITKETRAAVYMSPRVGGDANDDATRFGILDVRGEAAKIIGIFADFFPDVRDISAIAFGGRTMLFADVGLRRKVAIPMLGEGASRLLSALLAISACQDGVFLFDEFGIGVHHSLLPRMWKAVSRTAKQFNCQVFATTHSYECIRAASEAANEELMSDFHYVRLEKTKEGVVPIEYGSSELAEAVAKGWEVR